MLLFSCLLSIALATAYFIGFRTSAFGDPRSSLDVLRTVSETLALAVGPLGARLWPLSTVGTVAVVAFGAFAAAGALRHQASERDAERALGVLATLAALLLLILVLGYGRAHFGTGAGFSNRYTIFAACLLATSYLSIVLFLRNRPGRIVQALLLASVAVSFVDGLPIAVVYGTERAAAADALTSAIAAGAPPRVAAAIARDRLYPQESRLADMLGLLHARRAGVYEGFIGSDLVFGEREIDLPLDLADAVDCRLGPAFACWGEDPQLIFSLGLPAKAGAVRLKYRLDLPDAATVALQVFWRMGDAGFREQRSQTFRVTPSTEAQEITVWINEPLDQLRIDPARRDCVFELLGSTLLTAEGGG